MKKIKLFCFPYAGGAASAYNRWKLLSGESIEVIPVELAGRGRRMREPLYQNMQEALDDLYDGVIAQTVGSAYAFWGHSMGGSIAFELCRKIIAHGERGPMHLFISGRCPPSVYKESTILHNLPLMALKEEVMHMGGTQGNIFENPELLELFIPILRADFKLIEEYEYHAYNSEDLTINCGITAFSGTLDSLATEQDMHLWKNHTSEPVETYEFEGGHFFIRDSEKEIMEIIQRRLSKLQIEASYV